MSKQSALAATAFAAALAVAPISARAETAVADIVANYEAMAEAIFGDAAARARDLDKAIDALLAEPTKEKLDAARVAWKAARVPYMQSEGFRFGNKIVDDWEGKVNAWPLDEGLIDYVNADTYGDSSDENPLYIANVIANPKIQMGDKVVDAKKIDKALLVQLNTAMDVEFECHHRLSRHRVSALGSGLERHQARGRQPSSI